MHEGRCHKCGLKGELHPEELEGDLGLWLHVKRELGTMVDCQRNDNLKKKLLGVCFATCFISVPGMTQFRYSCTITPRVPKLDLGSLSTTKTIPSAKGNRFP